MSKPGKPDSFVYFPDTDEKKYIITERREDGTIREVLVSEEENEYYSRLASDSSENGA